MDGSRTKAALATLKTGNASKEAQDGARAHFLAPGMEVTVQVNWSGGGRLKDEDEKWDIDTVLRVAARFPDLVHR